MTALSDPGVLDLWTTPGPDRDTVRDLWHKSQTGRLTPDDLLGAVRLGYRAGAASMATAGEVASWDRARVDVNG